MYRLAKKPYLPGFLCIYIENKIIRRKRTGPSDLDLSFLIFPKKKNHKARTEVGCSGKSQQHRLLPPSFPPTSSLSTPYSLPSSILLSLNHLHFLFHKPGQCLPVVLPVESALFSPYFYAHSPVITAKPTHQQSMMGRDQSENYNSAQIQIMESRHNLWWKPHVLVSLFTS